jgi:hypothetical protein
MHDPGGAGEGGTLLERELGGAGEGGPLVERELAGPRFHRALRWLAARAHGMDARRSRGL